MKLKLKLTLASFAILLGAASTQAMPVHQTLDGFEAKNFAIGNVLNVAQRKFRRARTARRAARRTGASGFAANGGTVQDTCTSSHPFYGGDCSPKALTSRCDAAGGGMSSEPGGGVTCDTSHWD